MFPFPPCHSHFPALSLYGSAAHAFQLMLSKVHIPAIDGGFGKLLHFNCMELVVIGCMMPNIGLGFHLPAGLF